MELKKEMANSSNTSKPNIVLIMADDMGFSDIGCYGSEIATPNLDRLARNGVRFAQMYNNARCCPTRASLLTGLYPHQAGVGHMVVDRGIPPYQGYLNDTSVTIAEALKLGGYRTGMSGKWHVGGKYGFNRADWKPGTEGHPTPTQRGFDRLYGTLEGAANYFNPHTLTDGHQWIDIAEDEEYYYTDAISHNAAKMIGEFSKESDPFFLYVAYTAPHWPLHALPEDIAKYKGKYLGGWDAVRKARYERLIESGLIDSNWPLSPRDNQAPPWEQAEHKEWEDMRMAVYAAQVDRMDQGIGRIVEELERAGKLANTLIFFLSDNGGCAELLREDGGIERGYAKRDGSLLDFGNRPDRMPGGEDTFMSYDLPWANASNTPFRLYKHWVHEGGIATPLIAHWPAGIKRPDRITHRPSHLIDIMATCLDVAGVSYPAEYRDHRITPLEGESLLPALREVKEDRETPIFWEHEGNRAVRLGDWKLVSKRNKPWELYWMSEDRTELNDLAGVEPERVKAMEDMYNVWAQRCGVVPFDRLGKMK
jgi:arylsulfatase